MLKSLERIERKLEKESDKKNRESQDPLEKKKIEEW
jgi:hypothetical protein